jgi:hypothetical protein
MGDRTRIDDYRGRKDSALALHYLWRVGEAMVARRERFERVYALTEAIAPAEALREVDPAEAEDVLLRKQIAADGLTRLNGVRFFKRWSPRSSWPRGGLAGSCPGPRSKSGRGVKQAQLRRCRCGGPGLPDAGHAQGLALLGVTTKDEVTFCRCSTQYRARATALASSTREVRLLPTSASSATTRCRSCGDRPVGRFDPKLDRATGTLLILGLWLEDDALARDAAFGEALRLGMARFLRLLDARRIDVAAVRPPSLRKALRAATRR